MDEHLIRALRVANPWLRDEPLGPWFERFLPPAYVRRRLRLSADHRVVLVVGPRQAGKSTLIWHTLASDGRPVLYLNCEDPSVRTWLRSPALFLADLEELAPGVPILFFEEVQALSEAGLFLKGLVDHRSGKEIYATGSSSFDLEAETRESLAGRARRHLLLPLSLSEIAAADGPREGGGDRRGAALGRLELAETVEQALIFGSYPSVHGAARPQEELAALVESYIVRDASDRFRIRHLAALRKLLALAASQVGNLCNFSEWGALAGISQDTVVEYCRLLEETHVVRLLRPFIGGKRAELTKTPKVFFVDNGIRNQLFGGFAPASGRSDRGALMENLVFCELAKNLNPLLDSLRYWRSKSKAEVDFVVEHQGRLLACEVKAGDARGKISRSARSFLDAYRPQRFLIVHSGARENVEVGESRVELLALADLESAVRDFVGR
ncbi:MAG: ATP-binding protein [bacterium]|nr:ATP-binding protein [bacterium]